MVELAANIWADGPSSDPYEPDKAQIRAWGTWVEGIINAFTSTGGLIYSSKAALDADLAKPANSMAWVIGDPVAANNGVYGKVGASGTGSWTRRSDLPFSFIIASDAGAGTPDAIQATTAIPVSGSALVWMEVAETNTASPVTVSFNGGAALTIKTNAGNDIAAGGLIAGTIVMGIFSGSIFRLVSDQASSAIIAQAEAYAEAALAAANAGYVFNTEADFASANIPVVLQFVDTAGYYAAGDGGGHRKKRVSAPSPIQPWHKQSADGAWWEVAIPGCGWISPFAFGARVDGATDDIDGIHAALGFSAEKGVKILQPVGTMMVGEEIVYPDGAIWYGFSEELCIVKKTAAHVGRMLITENFDAQKGITDPNTAGLFKNLNICTMTFDGNWMTVDKSSYVNDAGGGGLFMYTQHSCILDGVTIKNMCGICWYADAPEGNDAGNPIGYSDRAKIRIKIDTCKEECFIYNGLADQRYIDIDATNPGARINSELVDPASPGPRSSPTYGATNGGLTHVGYFLRGGELIFVHAWGNFSGAGVQVMNGRFNSCFFMSETCGYGGTDVYGGYGDNNIFEAHRGGGRNGSIRPLVYYDAPTNDNVNFGDSSIIAYHKNTSGTSARNCVEFGPNARDFRGKVKTRGDNVPGHGVVIDGAANFIDMEVDCQGHVGTAPDGLSASAVYRKASFSTRSITIKGNVRQSAVGFRSSGTPRRERIDLEMWLDAGQLAFAGDLPTNTGQDWNINADINGTSVRSKNRGASNAFNSNSTAEQTVPIPHGLLAVPRFGRAQLTGILDSGTGIAAGAIQYMYVSDVDATNITAKVKLSVANGTDTQPRLTWTAEV